MTTTRFCPRALLAIAISVVAASAFTLSTSTPAEATIPTNGKLVYSFQGSLYLANGDGSSPTPLAGSLDSPAWSPDGLKLGFMASNGYFTTSDPDGSNQQAFDKPATATHDAAWSPDGTKIVYSTQTTINDVPAQAIVVHSFVDHNDVVILNRSLNDRSPTWSPDGTKIAFVSDDWSGPTRVWIMNSNGANAHVVPNQPAGRSRHANFSPDGTKLVFGNDPIDGNYTEKLYVIGIDGSGLKQVGPTTKRNSDGAFSPDGTKIVFAHNALSGLNNAATGLYVMNADGTDPTQLTQGDHEMPQWQPGTPIEPNLAPHAYGSVKAKGLLAVFANADWSFDDDGYIVKYEWRWGDYTPMAPYKYVWHRYTKPGTYFVRLTVTDDDGAKNTRQAWITVT